MGDGMRWFPVAETFTDSVAFGAADCRALGAWLRIANACRKTATGGRLAQARTRLRSLLRLAGISRGELAAALSAEVVRWDGDDLVVIGWDVAMEAKARAAGGPGPRQLPTGRAYTLSEAALAQRRAALRARYEPIVILDEPAHEPEATPESPAHSGDRPAAIPAAPASDSAPKSGTLPESVAPGTGATVPSLTTSEDSEITRVPEADPPPPSPSAATVDPGAGASDSGDDGGGRRPESSPGKAPEPVPTTAADIIKVDGVDVRDVEHATALGDPVAIARAFNANVGGERAKEWRRDADGLQAPVMAYILEWKRSQRDPVREPSGFRAARLEWRRLTPEDQDAIIVAAAGRYRIPVPDRLRGRLAPGRSP